MSSKNFSKLKNMVYSYLGYKKINLDNSLDSLIDECLSEIEKISSFKYLYQEYDYILDFLNKEPYLSYLGNKPYIISCMTLGIQIDLRITYYEKIDLTKMMVFDAASSAYLEYLSDEFERNLNINLGFRFCPGYGGSDVSDIRYIHKLLKADKYGITLLDSNLMIPQKSMIGIVGINNKEKKSCNNCYLEEKCKYKKEGLTCYLIK